MQHPVHAEELVDTNYLICNWRNKRIHTFPKGISLKVNVIVRLEFELAYYDIAIQHVNHDTIKASPIIKSEERL